MIQTAHTTRPIADEDVDRALRQLEAAWVNVEFDSLIAAGWPTDPPPPRPTRRISSARPSPREHPTPDRPSRRLSDAQVDPNRGARQRSPP